MFCFCCPKKKKSNSTNEIDKKLIDQNDSPRKNKNTIKNIALSDSNRKR